MDDFIKTIIPRSNVKVDMPDGAGLPRDYLPKFNLKDKVHIDNDDSIVGIITAIQWRIESNCSYEVSWFSNGKAESSFIEEWRLS
jgi:hypothetical protein